MKDNTSRAKGIIAAFIAAFANSWVMIIQKHYLPLTSSIEINYLLYLGASISILFFYKISDFKTKAGSISKDDKKRIFQIAVLEFFGSILIIEALKQKPSSTVALLVNFEIIVTAIIGTVYNDLKLDKYGKMAIVLITLASLIINYDGSGIKLFTSGALMPILAATCWGLGNNLLEKTKANTALVTLAKTSGVAIGQLFLSLFTKESITLQYPMLILYGALTYGISIYAYAKSVETISAAEATMIFSFQSLLAALFSILIYKDPVNLQFIIAAILMIIGIILTNKKEKA